MLRARLLKALQAVAVRAFAPAGVPRRRSRAAQAMALLQERERTAEALRQANMRFESALNNLSHGVLMCTADSRVAVANRRFCEILGIDRDRVVAGMPVSDVLALSIAAGNYPGRTFDEVYAEQAAISETGRRETATRTIAGGKIVSVCYEPMADGGWTATYEDITERCRSEQQIVFLARHDALTGLPNRVLFLERLQDALAQAERGTGFALLYLDLDQFKHVNDTLGHPVGDALLAAVALRLQTVVRESDTVARLGGDEFAILQRGVSQPAEVAGLAQRIVTLLGEPFEVEQHQLVIGTSIGVAFAPGDGAHPTQLLKNADLALYRAKRNGRGTWRFFEHAMDASAQARRLLEADLRNAVLLQQLELYYQPVVCSRTRRLTGFEALVRWNHPTRGMVPPSEFIPVAEEIGFIVPMGAWVLQQACTQAAAWTGHLRIAVNLSSVQFRTPGLVQTVSAVLEASGLPASRLELEITESLMLEDNTATLTTMHALRALGVRFAMDDFGTGYSSLSYLGRFPFDTIKIDKSFVRDVRTRDECIAIVRAVTSLANSLGMNTIAEGIETEEQFTILAVEGCSEMQGYLFSRPVPAAAVPALIARLSGGDGRRPALFIAAG